ncbi:MAG: hypothetical protein WCE94_15275 [Candidatus Methanoperedens sp.]
MEFNIDNIIYGLRHLPTDLIEDQKWDDLCEMLTDPDFLQAKLNILAVNPIPLSANFDLLRDFENALQALPANIPNREQVSIMFSIVTEQQKALIPSELGFISPLHGTFSSPTSIIVNIKDAFSSYEARKHMVSIIELLIKQYGLKLILVEGGSGDVNLKFLRNYASKEGRIEVAEKYLKNLKIGPEEYLDIVSDYPLIIWGIDDNNLYEKHHQAFMETEALRERLLPILTSLRQKNDLLKVRWQDSVMADFESKNDAYRKKVLRLVDFTNYLIRIATYHGINPEEYPNLSCFLHVFQLERFIDFKRVELERNTLVRELVQIMKYAPQRFSDAEIYGFIKRSNEFKEGKITDIYYYIGLERLVLSAGMELSLYGTFSIYLDSLKLNSQIRVPELVDELDRLVERLRITLAPTPQCKRLVTIDKQLQLIEKLLTHHLTPTDYQDFCSLSIKGIVNDWSSFIEEHLPAQCLSSVEIAQLLELESKLPIRKNEYEIAHSREKEMIKNILAKMDETKERIAVLIAGGFHSPKIVEGLKEHNIGIVEVTPKISQPVDEQLYLSVLKGQKHQ